jgi:hypothetical protein
LIFLAGGVAFFEYGLGAHVDQTPGRAEIDVTIGPHGDVDTRILTKTRSDGEMLEIGRAVGMALFPDHASIVRLDANRLSATIIDVHTEGVFIPGPAPVVTVNAGAGRRVLEGFALPGVAVRVCPAVEETTVTPPHKRSVGGDCVRTDPNAVLTIAMRPHPERWPRAVASTVGLLVLAGAGLLFHRRRPIVSLILTGIGVVVFFLVILWNPDFAEVTVAGRTATIGPGLVRAGEFVAIGGNAFAMALAAIRLQGRPPRGSAPPPPPLPAG